jgi:hypothetical protein
MKTALLVAYLSLACLGVAADENSADGAKGGLAGTALGSPDLGGHWTRRIILLLDSKASPPEIFQVNSNLQRSASKQMEEKRSFLTNGLALVGAEAQIIVEYYDAEHDRRFSLHIYRYPTTEEMDSMWKKLLKSRIRNVKTVSGEEVIYTNTGQDLSKSLRTEQPSVEERQGRYHIMIAPGKPEEGDPGLEVIRKQVEKIRRATEP